MPGDTLLPPVPPPAAVPVIDVYGRVTGEIMMPRAAATVLSETFVAFPGMMPPAPAPQVAHVQEINPVVRQAGQRILEQSGIPFQRQLGIPIKHSAATIANLPITTSIGESSGFASLHRAPIGHRSFIGLRPSYVFAMNEHMSQLGSSQLSAEEIRRIISPLKPTTRLQQFSESFRAGYRHSYQFAGEGLFPAGTRSGLARSGLEVSLHEWQHAMSPRGHSLPGNFNEMTGERIPAHRRALQPGRGGSLERMLHQATGGNPEMIRRLRGHLSNYPRNVTHALEIEAEATSLRGRPAITREMLPQNVRGAHEAGSRMGGATRWVRNVATAPRIPSSEASAVIKGASRFLSTYAIPLTVAAELGSTGIHYSQSQSQTTGGQFVDAFGPDAIHRAALHQGEVNNMNMANSSSWPHPMNVWRALGHVFSPYGALAPVTREVSGAMAGATVGAPTNGRLRIHHSNFDFPGMP